MVLTISSWSKLLKTAMLLKFSLSCQMHTTTAGFELTNREPRFADGHRFFVDYFVQFFVTFANRNFLSVRIFVLGKPRNNWNLVVITFRSSSINFPSSSTLVSSLQSNTIKTCFVLVLRDKPSSHQSPR